MKDHNITRRKVLGGIIAIYDRVQGFDTAGAGAMAAVLLAISLTTISLTFWLSARFGRRFS